MTIIDYKKDTGEFHIHVFGKISQLHIDFLKRFIPKSKKSDDISIGVGSIFENDDQHETYFDLISWGFLEDRYDHSIDELVVQLTSIGKKIIEQF